MKEILKNKTFRVAGAVLLSVSVIYGMALFELWRRARAAYQRGEAYFEKGDFRRAMWEYQEVQEFYQPPRWKWVERAEAREWECRAYLNDWTPPEGPLDADVRREHPDIYEKYRERLMQITPVPEKSEDPMPEIPHGTPFIPASQ